MPAARLRNAAGRAARALVLAGGPGDGRFASALRGRAAPRLVLAAALALTAALALAGRPADAAAQGRGPIVRAPAALLVEPATNDVVFARDARRQRAIASTTKLMTALVTLEQARLSDVVTTARYRALPAESVAGLQAGERMTVADLLRALLLASANDAAATLAVRVGGTQARFVRLMNARARGLGLRARFANPIGLDDPGNHGSAADLVKLALILRRNAFFRRVTDLPRATLRSGDRERTIVNRNTLVRTVRAVDGVKTGHTRQAGYVLVGSATRRGVTVVSAVLGDPSEAVRDADTIALLRYGLRRYRRATAVRRGQPLARARLAHREEHVALAAQRTVRRTVRRGERVALRVTGVPAELDGPLPRGARVGAVELRWRGRTIDRVPLVTTRPVAAATFLQRSGGALLRTAVVLAALGALLGSLQAVRLRRRRIRRARRRRARGTGLA
jgi:D-alanyl-D-alanine carboxypeptidase (penicillin-binding protein 5/6)